VSLLVGSAVLLAIFLIAEVRQERPMLDLSLFKKPAFTGASLVALAISSSMFSMFLYLTLYVQDVLGYDPLQAGLRFLPITLVSFVVAPISGKVSVSVPVGLLLVSGGLLSMTAIDAASGWTTLIPGFVLAGAGIGMINPPLASTAVGVVHHSRSGMASGINNTFRQVGIATGVAGLGAVFQHQIAVKTTSAMGGGAVAHGVVSNPHFNQALVSGAVRPIAERLPPPAHAALIHAYRVGFTGALTSILLIASAIALLGAIAAFALIRSSDFVASYEPGAESEPAPVAAG